MCRSYLCGVLLAATGYGTGIARAVVVDFEDLTLPPETAAFGDPSQAPFVSHGLTFNRTWSTEFNCCPGGWAYSNQTDVQTAGFGNPYSAYHLPAGGGVHGSANFAVANNLVQGEATIDFPTASHIDGTYVANTTYVFRAVVDGDDGGANFVKGPFSNGDWLKVEFVGLDAVGAETGVVEFFLADYRDGQSRAISEWTWVDLSSLGSRVTSLEFRMNSTDVGPFGMNSPAYFAIDDLTYSTVPEPAGWNLLAMAFCILAAHSTRSRRRGFR